MSICQACNLSLKPLEPLGNEVGISQSGQNHPDTRETSVIMTESQGDMSQGSPGAGSLD